MSTFDVVIAGAGVVGTACAAACAQAGMRVAIVERDVIGGGTTAAGMGHIVVMDDSEAQFALTRYSQLLWAEMARDLPHSAEYERTGTLWLAADDEEMAEAERKRAYYTERDVPAVVLSRRELADLEPNLRSGLAGALLVPQDAVAYPPIVALHLARAAEKQAAVVMIGRDIRTMSHGKVVLDNGEELNAAHVINATGAWATNLNAEIPVKKRKGHLVITDRYTGFVRHQLVELGYLKSAHSVSSDSVAFNVQPRRTGQVLIGSSRQYGDESSSVNQAILSRMLQRASEYMPEIGSLNAIRVWTGFRAATPDKLPLIGPSIQDETIWLATGHEGLGITTSLATGALVAAALAAQRPAIPLEPYLPERFSRAATGQQPGKESICNGKA